MTKTQDELELKNCPFCGGEASFVETHHSMTEWYGVTCANYEEGCICNHMAATEEYKAEAIAAWNIRAPDPVLEEVTNKDMIESFREHEDEILRERRVDTSFEIGFKAALKLAKAKLEKRGA